MRSYIKTPEYKAKHAAYMKEYYKRPGVNELRKKNRKKNYDPERNKNMVLKRLYGINLEDYDKLYQSQNGCCGVCQKQLKARGKSKDSGVVDHDHVTGKVRGILCSACNTALGLLGENITTMLRAIEYTKKHTT